MGLQAAGAVTDVAPGMWVSGAKEGLVFVANTTEFDQVVEAGTTLGVVAMAGVQTRVCEDCGMVDTDAWPSGPQERRCKACGVLLAGGSSQCRGCGAGPERSRVLGYAGCEACGTKGRDSRDGSRRPTAAQSSGLVAAKALWMIA